MSPRRRPAALAVLVFLTVRTGIAGAAEPAPSYRYLVTARDLEAAPRLEVEWSELDEHAAVRRSPAATPLRVCTLMRRAGRHVTAPSAGDPAAPVPLRRAADDDECFVGELPAGAPRAVRYGVDLAGLASGWGDPDFASRVPGGVVTCDRSFLLRPEPLPEGRAVEVELRLPEGASAAAAWTRRPGPGLVYRLNSDDLETGSYLAIGKLCPLADVPVRGGVMAPVLLCGAHRAPDEVLRRWVAAAAGAVADFYGGLPRPRVHVLLAPVPGSRDGGVFGSVLRLGRVPSAMLLFGAEAEDDAAFADDWVSVHELFHLGNPAVEGKIPWFVEGFTTYYQDVLRGRMHPGSAAAMWGDLHDGFRRHCDAADDDSGPLGEESRTMRQTHRWTRVYWGGACLAFQVDVAIRRRSGSRESLDSVLRQMRARGEGAELSEDEVVATLDRAAGRGLVRERLRARGRSSLPALYRELGIEPTGPAEVRLHDDAPLAPLRRAIF